jgi:predicted GIY-YIG superfamily endonuclease
MLKNDTYISFNLVYVLKCEDDCWYIGVSSNLNARLAQHFEGNGCSWTRKHKPIKLIEVHVGGETKENEITEKYIEKYTLDKVSGGKYVRRSNKISLCFWLKSIKL